MSTKKVLEETKMTPTEFIRTCPKNWSAEKVLEEAKKAKILITKAKTIWNVRYQDRKKTKKKKKRVSPKININSISLQLPPLPPHKKIKKEIPISMLLWCPGCNHRHVDIGEFATKIHHTHACQYCGMAWRPAVQATVGVQFLPGFKNQDK